MFLRDLRVAISAKQKGAGPHAHTTDIASTGTKPGEAETGHGKVFDGGSRRISIAES